MSYAKFNLKLGIYVKLWVIISTQSYTGLPKLPVSSSLTEIVEPSPTVTKYRNINFDSEKPYMSQKFYVDSRYAIGFR